MKFKLIGDNNYNGDLFYEILKNRGFDDEKIESLINLDDSIIRNFYDIHNSKIGIDMFIRHVKNNSKIALIVDSDADGFCSSAQIYKYIKTFNPNCKIKVILHEGKAHGFSDTIDRCLGSDFIICPDAGSNDYEYHKIIKQNKIDCLIIDHHETDVLSKDVVVINNVYSGVSENFSGSGMVFKFLQEVDKILNENISESLYEIMAIGMIGDMMDLSDLEAMYYIQSSLDKFSSPFSKSVSELKKIKNITPKDVSFYFAPLINSVTRTGTREDKINLFKLLAMDKIESFNSIKKVKERQDKEVSEFLERNKSNLIILESIVVLKTSEENGFSGLIGNKLAQKYNKPTIVINKKLNGSCRSPFSDDIDFRNILLNTGMFEFCLGHKNAFGLKINSSFCEKNLDLFIKNKNLDKLYEVDFVLDYNDATNFFIHEIYENKRFFAKGVDEPKIIIKNIPTNIFEFKKTFIEGRSLYHNCYYVKFFENIETFKTITSSNKINVVCTTDVNNFIGTKYQFIIEDIFLDEPVLC